MGSISYGSQEGTARTGWNLRWKSNDPPDSLLPQESINQCDLVCPLQLVPAALMMMSDCACRTEFHRETVSGHLCYLSVDPCPSLPCFVSVWKMDLNKLNFLGFIPFVLGSRQSMGEISGMQRAKGLRNKGKPSPCSLRTHGLTG